MRAISQVEYQDLVFPIFGEVFAEADPFGEPFQPHIKLRLLLYNFRWVLHDPWLAPIVDGMEELGESGFYISLVSTMLGARDDSSPDEIYAWYVPLEDARTYKTEFGPYANAICSPHGTWGLICSYEDHAVVGGDDVLIGKIRASIPDLSERVGEFINVWKHYHKLNNADISWMPKLLGHVFGHATARQMIIEASLEDATGLG